MGCVNKRISFLIAVILTGIFFAVKMRPPAAIYPSIRMLVTENSEPVTAFDQERTPRQKRHTFIEYVSFPLARELTHHSLGSTEIRRNLFLDLKTALICDLPGEYEFLIQTDQATGAGVRIKADDEVITEHDSRDYITRTSRYFEKGIHLLEINYIQGEGVINNLEVFFSPPEDENFYPLGNDTETCRFLPPLR